MLTGILSVLLLVLTCIKYITHKFHFKSADKLFSKIHVPIGIALIIVSVLHIVFIIPLLNVRPIHVLLSGILGMLCIVFSALSKFIFKNHKRALSIHRFFALAACLLVVLHVALNLVSLNIYQNEVKHITIESVDLSNIPDGVYVGEADVTFVYAKVAVTVKSSIITNIEILEHRNERGQPAERIVADIVSQQRIDVDAVSSATNSSIVIKKAVQNALTASK